MNQNHVTVCAAWDEVANVWVTTTSDVPGLVTEADSWQDLQAKLDILVPELLETNGRGSAGADLVIELIENHPWRPKSRRLESNLQAGGFALPG